MYKGDYTATHPTVRMFWETFHAFPLEKKKKFLCKYLAVVQYLLKLKPEVGVSAGLQGCGTWH